MNPLAVLVQKVHRGVHILKKCIIFHDLRMSSARSAHFLFCLCPSPPSRSPDERSVEPLRLAERKSVASSVHVVCVCAANECLYVVARVCGIRQDSSSGCPVSFCRPSSPRTASAAPTQRKNVPGFSADGTLQRHLPHRLQGVRR